MYPKSSACILLTMMKMVSACLSSMKIVVVVSEITSFQFKGMLETVLKLKITFHCFSAL